MNKTFPIPFNVGFISIKIFVNDVISSL